MMKKFLAWMLVLCVSVTTFYVPSIYLADEQGVGQSSLPTSYSSSSDAPFDVDVKKDYVTSVKSQGVNNCWAYAAISSAETTYIINEGKTDSSINADSIDFNENHITHFMYETVEDPLGLFGGDTNELLNDADKESKGGDLRDVLYTFANWVGASDSMNFSSEDISLEHDDSEAFDDAAHMQDGFLLNMPEYTSDNFQEELNPIKQMIMEYGSVVISYGSDPGEIAGSEGAGYYYNPEYSGSAHAVVIVGWDDTISATNFETTPPGDGAWLVKNSWGAEHGLYEGYFWMSYYETTIQSEAYVYNFVSADNYDNNYQYDGTVGDTYYYDENEVWQANAFVADSHELLEAVGFYTFNEDVEYEIRIYKNLTELQNPQEGNLVLTQTGVQEHMGFHTVELSESIIIQKGERYAIVIALYKDGEYLKVPLTYTWEFDVMGDCEYFSYAKAGESYYGLSLEEMTDLNPDNTEYADGSNLRIKAFTNEYTGSIISETGIKLNVTSATLQSHETLQLVTTIAPGNATFRHARYISSNPELVTVNGSGLVKVNQEGLIGTATITVISEYTGQTATCEITVAPGRVTKITLPNDKGVFGRQEIQLTADIFPSTAATKTLKWTSSDESIATVDQNGLVTTHSAGTVYITATATDEGGVSDTCMIIVEDQKVYSVWLTPTELELAQGETYTLSAKPNPSNAFNTDFAWESSDESIVTVDENGNVTAVGVGTAIITVKSTDGSNVSATCEITVSQVKVSKIILNYTGYDLIDGESFILQATVTPDNVANKNLIWSSDDESVAIVDQNGKVTAVGVGRANIRVESQDGGAFAHCTVYVTANIVTRIDLDCTFKILEEGESFALTATVYPENATYQDLIWYSTDETVATVDETGKVTAVGQGTAYVYVETLGDYAVSACCEVQINKQGLHLAEDGEWYYYTDNEIDTSVNGLMYCDGTKEYLWEDWFYFENGKLEWNYVGLSCYNGGWYYVEGGVINWEYTGLTCYYGTWYYVEGGVLNWNYTGLTYYYGTWYYVEGGVLNWGYTGLTYYYGTWYYVEGGVLNWGYTGLTYYGGTWYYVEGGVLNWNYTGLTYYGGTWYYVEGGVLNWNYTGLTNYGGTWYYVEGSVLNWGYTGLVYHYGTWYYVGNGVLDWNFTGTVYQYGSWWYVENGIMVGLA